MTMLPRFHRGAALLLLLLASLLFYSTLSSLHAAPDPHARRDPKHPSPHTPRTDLSNPDLPNPDLSNPDLPNPDLPNPDLPTQPPRPFRALLREQRDDGRDEVNPLQNKLHVFGPRLFTDVPPHLRPHSFKSLVSELFKHLRLLSLPLSYCTNGKTLAARWLEREGKEWNPQNSWERYFAQIDTCRSYSEERFKSVILPVIRDLKTSQVESTENFGEGTQLKILIHFEGGFMGNLKPKRFNREFETDPNHFYFSDYERHNAEVASFHLDRVLGLFRGVPTTMRLFNLRTEIWATANRRLNKTFFVSPSENVCVVGKCDYYCDTTHAICGNPEMKEFSVQLWLPSEDDVRRREFKSPFKRTYSKQSPNAVWQTEMDYCEKTVYGLREYAHGRSLPDLVEIGVFDFLIGNQDRHHYETFIDYFKEQTFPIFLDQGRGFGRSYLDDMDILAPLTQCCVIRPGFLLRLLDIAGGNKTLTQRLKESILEVEEAQYLPILADKQYESLERRLNIVLQVVRNCIEEKGVRAVVMNEYHNPAVQPGEGTELPNSDEE